MIDGAELLIRTSDADNSQSGDTIALHRLLDPWTLDATWNSKGDGISNDAADAILAANDTISPTVRGEFLVFDVTESLAAWAAGAPNYGWALLPGGTNGWRWDTSERGVGVVGGDVAFAWAAIAGDAVAETDARLNAGAVGQPESLIRKAFRRSVVRERLGSIASPGRGRKTRA